MHVGIKAKVRTQFGDQAKKNGQSSIKRRWHFLIFNILAINKNPFLRLLTGKGERKFEETLHVFLGQILAFLFPPEFEEFDKT